MVQGVQKREQATLGALRRKSKKTVRYKGFNLFICVIYCFASIIYLFWAYQSIIQTFFWPNAPQDK